MKIVVAMDSFKGSLSALRACEIVRETLIKASSDTEVIIKPMADGGEGTADAMLACGKGQWVSKAVTGPLRDMQVKAGFAWFEAERMAVVEMASASGLTLLLPEQRNPLNTTTYGTGELIASAVKYGAKRILLAVGGSATVDGGTGAAEALGWRFLDSSGNPLNTNGGALLKIDRLIPPAKPEVYAVEVLCDVRNPLCGPNGAAYVYGPQKGANTEKVEQLETGLTHLAELVKEQLGLDIKDIPGAGAAGGLAAGAIAFMDAELVSGIETVMDWSGLRETIADADWIITGEGRFDHQSLHGKVVSGIVQTASNTKARVAVIAGQVLMDTVECERCGVKEVIGCMNDNTTLEYAIKNSEELLEQASREFANRHLNS